jgi:hypothetical protein
MDFPIPFRFHPFVAEELQLFPRGFSRESDELREYLHPAPLAASLSLF